MEDMMGLTKKTSDGLQGREHSSSLFQSYLRCIEYHRRQMSTVVLVSSVRSRQVLRVQRSLLLTGGILSDEEFVFCDGWECASSFISVAPAFVIHSIVWKLSKIERHRNTNIIKLSKT